MAEAAQKLLRSRLNVTWPTPKGNDAVQRLQAAVRAMAPPQESELQDCLQEARTLWSSSSADKWRIVRGKYVLPKFTQKASTMTSGQALLEAIARARPKLTRLQPFEDALRKGLTQAP